MMAVITSLVISGCQTDVTGLTDVSEDTTLSAAAADAIAGDMVSRLTELVGPAGATIRLQDSNSTFGIALEAALKGWGYKIALDANAGAEERKTVTLSYALEAYEGQILARLSTQSVAIGRAYAATAASALPISALSVARSG
jgi:hypothetical protein